MNLLSYFTRHRTAANLLLAIMIVLGLAAAPKMRAQFFPDIIINNVSVSLIWSGASAEDIDSAIVDVLEPTLLAVEGVDASYTTSREGRASITLEFEPDWDMARAAEDVQAAVDLVTDLPEDMEVPQVRRGNWRDRVTDVVIKGPVPPDQLALLADELSIRLFAEGVTRTTIRGIAAPETIVEVPSLSLIQHDISMTEIAAAIRGEVNSDPTGDIESANTRIRAGTETRSPEQISAIALRTNADGSQLLIGDIATVEKASVDRGRAYFVGEDSAISMRVDRSQQGDAIAIQEEVERVVAELRPTLPSGVEIDLIRTRAEAITGRLNILLDNGAMGLGLVLLLLFLFLNARTAFWVAAGIPVAMLATIALMYLFGQTINMVSLFALIITLGIVVDDAIVVGEHADFRARKLGESPFVAAENAAKRMAAPVFSATITTIIAFFGLAAIGGRFGDLIWAIPLTVIAVLAASLIECFLVLPNHMAHALKAQDQTHWYDWPSRMVNRGFNWVNVTLFQPFIRFVIWARYPVVAATIVIFASQAALFLRGDLQWRFFNAPEQSSVTGNFAMSAGASREDSIEMMHEMQRAAAAVAAQYETEYGRNPIVYVLAEIGGNSGRRLSGADTKTPDQLGSIAIELIDADLRPYSAFKFVADLQEAVVEHTLAETVSFRGWRSGPGGDSLHIQLFGATPDILKQASEDLRAALSRFPEVSALEDNLAYDREELILELTPQGQALGFTIDTLGNVLSNRLRGIEAATYPEGPRTASIRVELPAGEITADFLERSMLRTNAGGYVPLADIVSVTTRTGFSTVRRENGLRLISVTGDLSEDNPARAAEINALLVNQLLPEIEAKYGIGWKLAGLAEQEREFLSDALLGFLLCLVGIYLTLAWIFASWTRPAVVLAIAPFGLVGAIYGHVSWEVPLSIFSVVGLIGMTGIIINDSIVLVTTVDDYAKNRGYFDAICDATSDRLRPVLLTTLTTVLGLTPLLFEGSVQAEFLKPTVITLVYGLGFGMFLVLLIVPSLLAMQTDLRRLIDSFRRAIGFRGSLRPIGTALLLSAFAVMGWFAYTFGQFWITGQAPALLDVLLPPTAALAAQTQVMIGYLFGAVIICVLAYGVLAFTRIRRG